MKHNRKYKLLKDLPDGAIVGDIYVDNGYGRYTNQRMDASKSPVIEHNSYFSWQVETSTDFFEEVNTVEGNTGITNLQTLFSKLVSETKIEQGKINYFSAALSFAKEYHNRMSRYIQRKKPMEQVRNPEPSSKKEEGWEILSFQDANKPHILFEKGDDGYFRMQPYHGGQQESLLLKNPNLKIFSVLRKSDNTVFTVGDETTIGVIKRFEVSEELMYWWNEHTWYYLSQAIKAPTNTVEDKPLFVTEDGVEINKSDDIVLHHVSPNFDLSWSGSRYLSKQDRSDLKIFSTEEKAKEYILLNKPMYSVWDAWSFLCVYIPLEVRDEAIKGFKINAKSKTNNQ